MKGTARQSIYYYKKTPKKTLHSEKNTKTDLACKILLWIEK